LGTAQAESLLAPRLRCPSVAENTSAEPKFRSVSGFRDGEHDNRIQSMRGLVKFSHLTPERNFGSPTYFCHAGLAIAAPADFGLGRSKIIFLLFNVLCVPEVGQGGFGPKLRCANTGPARRAGVMFLLGKRTTIKGTTMLSLELSQILTTTRPWAARFV